MQTTCPYDLVIGLDRSDTKADVHLINLQSGKRCSQTISTSSGRQLAVSVNLRRLQLPSARRIHAQSNALENPFPEAARTE